MLFFVPPKNIRAKTQRRKGLIPLGLGVLARIFFQPEVPNMVGYAANLEL